MKMSSTKVTAIILGLLVLGGIVLYGFLYWSILQKEASIVALSQDIANENEKVKHLDQNKALFDQIKAKRETIDSYFLGPKDEDTVAFLVSLEALASTSKVKLELNTPSFAPIVSKNKSVTAAVKSKDPIILNKEVTVTAVTIAKWETLRLQVKVEGSWPDIMQFIALVEAMPYDVTFSQANLTLIPNFDPKKKVRVWDGVFTLNVIKNK